MLYHGLLCGESVPRYMVAAAGSMSTKKKKKGKFSIFGLLRLLGHFRRKLDRVLTGFALKPIPRRKRVRILGFRKFVLGWVSGSVLEAGSSQNLEPGLEPGSDLDLKPDLDFGSNLDPSLVFPLVSKVVLSPKVSGLIPSLEIVRNSSPVKLSLSLRCEFWTRISGLPGLGLLRGMLCSLLRWLYQRALYARIRRNLLLQLLLLGLGLCRRFGNSLR